MAVELLKVKDFPNLQDYPLYLQQMKVFTINENKKNRTEAKKCKLFF